MPQQLLPQILVQSLVDLGIPPPHSDYEALHHYVPSFQQNLPFVINEWLLLVPSTKLATCEKDLTKSLTIL